MCYLTGIILFNTSIMIITVECEISLLIIYFYILNKFSFYFLISYQKIIFKRQVPNISKMSTNTALTMSGERTTGESIRTQNGISLL